MLDRKIKDIDAGIEILEDRVKLWKSFFFTFLSIGWASVWLSVCLLPYHLANLGIGTGISLLIFATWGMNNWNYLNVIILLKKDKVKEK